MVFQAASFSIPSFVANSAERLATRRLRTLSCTSNNGRVRAAVYCVMRAAANWLGAVLATLSGFTSFVAHAGGPPINAYVIPLKLSPVRFTATMACFFFVVNICKWIPYAWLGLLDMRNMTTSLVLLAIAPIGVWIGVRWARRISQVVFYRFLYAGMLLTGLKLVWDGLLA